MAALLGPFTQAVTMRGLPSEGRLSDSQLEIIPNAGILIENGLILDIKPYSYFKGYPSQPIQGEHVAIPGLIDAHTHLCYAGTRAQDYSLYLAGKTYPEIAKGGGGILKTVRSTREASLEKLTSLLKERLYKAFLQGITTVEIKSGYGLTLADEIKILEAIHAVKSPVSVIATCLALHKVPEEYENEKEWLEEVISHILPEIKKRELANRVDIFIDPLGFSAESSYPFLSQAKEMGFSIVIHADQFERGAIPLAASLPALSADHLEASIEEDFLLMKERNVIPVVLPGACLGLGLPFPQARKMLDIGLPLVIASDTNPGTSPMGNLVAQASILAAYEKLTTAEVLAALTVRAASALELSDRGVLDKGKRADIAIYETSDYREILYNQGSLLPKLTLSSLC